ncbi:major facilitator superfamily transporter [Ceratobasidium sp. AG-Ba]|nr:major facilitator superfamily transporter [Ceratobasidium sp. AG-Ba]
MVKSGADERQALLPNASENGLVQEYGTASSSGTSTPSLVKPSSINNPSKKDLLWILGGLWSAVFLGALDTTIVATLLSPIGSYFQKSHQASYLGTSYLLSVCCFTPLYGRLSDIMGRKGAMLLALSLFGTGTLLCGLANSMEFLIFARAVAGMGGGGVMTVSSIAVTDLIPLKQRGLYQGLANILFGLGSGIGGPLGGWINDTFGWRAAFLIQIPILVMSAIVIVLKVNIKLPDSEQTTRQKLARIDYAGSFTLVVCVGCLLLGLSLKTSEDLAWNSPFVIGLLCTSAVFAVCFVYAEARWAPEPVMPLRLLSQRTPLSVALSNFWASCVAFSMLYNVPLYFSAVRLKSAADSGFHLLPNAIAVSCGSVFAGWMMRKTGKLYYLTLASALGMLLSSSLIAAWNNNTAEYHLWGDIVFGGFGGSSLITSTLIALIASVDKKDYAVATGISYLFRTTGQVLGVSLSGALVQAVLTSSLRKGITGPGAEEIILRIRHSTAVIPTLEAPLREVAVQSYEKALRSVFIGQAVLSFLAFLCTLPIQENPLPGSHEEQEQQERRRREASGRNNP